MSIAARRAENGELAALVDAALSPVRLQQLDRVRARGAHASGPRPGNTSIVRRSHATGIEIESHRPYGSGDDPRRIDWNAYGRLDQLVVRLFRAEREVPRHFLVDVSASMAVPAADRKLPWAAALIASLAYIGVRNHDPVTVVRLGGGGVDQIVSSPTIRHLRQLPVLRDFLVATQPRGEAHISGCLARWLATRPPRGTALLASDFLMPPEHYQQGIEQVRAYGIELACARLLGPLETDPSRAFHHGRVVDAETQAARQIKLDATNLERYRAALREQELTLASVCQRNGAAFTVADTTREVGASLIAEIG